VSGVRVMWMRGGTSKGGFFLAEDLPADRDTFLLRVLGSPDPRQIDGMGGGDPLTSKVAVVNRSLRTNVDVDYLFLQVAVDKAQVSDAQNCGNILAGIGPFAIERGLVSAQDGVTKVRVFMVNTGQVAIATVETPGGKVCYDGVARIDGVPGRAAPVPIEFRDTAGSSCGALLPSGNPLDIIEGIEVTMIDNGMPVVMMRARDLGVSGQESPETLETNAVLCEKIETIRQVCGQQMNLGDVTDKTVPKMTLISEAQSGGAIATRTFIPHRCHKAIGVLGAVSVATACLTPGSVAHDMAVKGEGSERKLAVEHPTGELTVVAQLGAQGEVESTAILRTARKLMDGAIFA